MSCRMWCGRQVRGRLRGYRSRRCCRCPAWSIVHNQIHARIFKRDALNTRVERMDRARDRPPTDEPRRDPLLQPPPSHRWARRLVAAAELRHRLGADSLPALRADDRDPHGPRAAPARRAPNHAAPAHPPARRAGRALPARGRRMRARSARVPVLHAADVDRRHRPVHGSELCCSTTSAIRRATSITRAISRARSSTGFSSPAATTPPTTFVPACIGASCPRCMPAPSRRASAPS